jgi:hypothetical protein
MKKIYHIENKQNSSHKYYGSLSALFLDNINLGVSRSTLDRFDFTENYFENKNVIIRKSNLQTTGSIRVKNRL